MVNAKLRYVCEEGRMFRYGKLEECTPKASAGHHLFTSSHNWISFSLFTLIRGISS